MKYLFLISSVVLALLSACGGTAPLPATQELTIALEKSETPSLPFHPSETFTRTPSRTFPPAVTLTPSFHPPTVDPTEAFIATGMAAYETKVAVFEPTCPAGDAGMNMSPDGEWTFCDVRWVLNVVSQSGTKWVFSYSNDLGKDFVGYTRLVHWSTEEHFLYYSPMVHIDGIQPLPFNGLALYRMDLSTGAVDTVLPVIGTVGRPHFYTLSISPTGRRLAYVSATVSGDPAEIVVLDLKTGEKKSIHPGATADNVNGFDWSADGLEMTYSVYDPTINESFYFTYNMTTFELIRSEPFNP